MRDFHIRDKFVSAFAVLMLLLISVPAFSSPPVKDTITVEEIVTKHLDSIGSAQARAATKSRIILGTCIATFRGRTTGTLNGQTVFASQGVNNLFLMRFRATDYRLEGLAFNGKDYSIGYILPGTRSTFGDFLYRSEAIFKQGLIGGALSSSWSLLNTTSGDAKLSYGGTGKIGDRKVYKVRFLPKNGSDLQIIFFFDADNFQHLRTQYEKTIGAGLGSNIDNSVRQSETRFKMVEDFSDFKKEGNLVLPHTYVIQFSVTGNAGATINEWKTNLVQYNFNRPIDMKSFDLGTY
ncbi:MAG: hypothetical protein MSG64_12375 [Pyrinomonadaceae bacterium MAG19_C2-C3]|nr:hypothetical protein [Pyrinomonadaceae bacterium MAG19_C2-C3]